MSNDWGGSVRASALGHQKGLSPNMFIRTSSSQADEVADDFLEQGKVLRGVSEFLCVRRE